MRISTAVSGPIYVYSVSPNLRHLQHTTYMEIKMSETLPWLLFIASAYLLSASAQDALNGTLFKYSNGLMSVAFMTGESPGGCSKLLTTKLRDC